MFFISYFFSTFFSIAKQSDTLRLTCLCALPPFSPSFSVSSVWLLEKLRGRVKIMKKKLNGSDCMSYLETG